MPTIRETINKVEEFAELPEGWHFGEGLPPTQERIGQAVAFLEYANFSNLERANAFPGVRGQIEVTFYNADRMLEITIEADDSVTIAEDKGNEQVSFEENLSKYDAYQRLDEFSQSIWVSSDHFIGSIMTQSVRVPVSPAARWTSGAENRFQLWIATAQGIRVVPSARISLGTITSRLAIQQYIGRSGTMIFLTGVESYPKELAAEMNAIGTSTVGEERLFDEPLRAV